MRKPSDFPFITSKRPLLMSQLPFEQYRRVFKLIKTRQQYGPFLTQVSPRDFDFINLWTTTLKQRQAISHVCPVGEGQTWREWVVCQWQGSAGVIGTPSSLGVFLIPLPPISPLDNPSALFIYLVNSYKVLVVLWVLRGMRPQPWDLGPIFLPFKQQGETDI